MVPKVDGRYLSVWAVDPGTGRIASMTKAGITVNAADDGRQLALWPGVSLHGGGQYIGYHFRRINGMTFLDRGAALVAHDTRDYGRPEMKSRLWIWHWQTGPPRLLSDQNSINMVAVSPSGDFFATAEGGNFYDDDKARSVSLGASQIRVWRSETGAVAYTIPMDDAVDAVAFSPDGTRLAARVAAGIFVYRAADQAEIARFKFKGERTTALVVSFALGGRQVVAATSDGVRIWGIDGGESRLLRHDSGWPRLTLSADGRLIATRTDQVLRIWDAASGSELFEMGFSKNQISNALFVGPNHELVVITNTGLVKILWKAGAMIDEACRRLGRNISPAESRRFFGDGSPPPICPESISPP
jgi:WD40 repeat protein